MAKPGIQVPYNFDLKPLEQLLSKVTRPGDYFVVGSLEAPMPRLEVERVGLLSFPVPAIQARQLIENAIRAPYGRGEETILDESVRKVWQVPAEKVQLGGKSWDGTFAQILATVANGLGCAGAAMQAELYKLLVYDEGGFFKPHRDTEKSERMFGTLVVVLPSVHQGGELVIRHAGREVKIDLSSSEVSELRFAAFYADCEHEVLPVARGNRVCLIYNLVQRGSGEAGARLAAPLYDAEAEAAASMLRETFAADGAPAKLAWLLEHQYSPGGLAFDALKGADAGRASVLRRAAERAGCVMHLAIVHIEETGAAEPEYDPYSRRSGRRGYDESAEEEDVSSDSFEVIEVCDASQFVDEWCGLDGRPVDFGRLPLEEGEVLPAGALDGETPDEQRLTEATGNEGATFERSYHRAALLIWPRSGFADVLLQAGVGAALPLLLERIASRGEAAEEPTDPASALALARRIVEEWEASPLYSIYRSGSKDPDRGEMVRLLVRLGDASLLERFIEGVVTHRFEGTEAAALAEGAAILGPKRCGKLFIALALENTRVFHGGCIALLHGMMSNLGPVLDSKWKAPMRRIAATILAELATIGVHSHPDPYAGLDSPRVREARPMSAAEVVELLESLRALDSVELHTTAVAVIRGAPAVFDPVTVVVPALQQLPDALGTELTSDTVRRALWLHAADFLLARSERPPELPVDWRQEVTVSCKCEDCRELQAFVHDPVAKVHRFRVRQDRRQHLHGQIEHHGLDLTHVTERQGSPQTLVCTKTRRSYQRQCAQHAADCAAMGTLVGLLGAVSGDAEIGRVANRLNAATVLRPRPDMAAP